MNYFYRTDEYGYPGQYGVYPQQDERLWFGRPFFRPFGFGPFFGPFGFGFGFGNPFYPFWW